MNTVVVVFLCAVMILLHHCGGDIHVISYSDVVSKTEMIQFKQSLSAMHTASLRIWTREDLLSSGQWYSSYGDMFMNLNRADSDKAPKLIHALLKPLMILDALKRSRPGDVIVYSDIVRQQFHPLLTSPAFLEVLEQDLLPLASFNHPTEHCTCIPGTVSPTSSSIGYEFDKYANPSVKSNISYALSAFSIPYHCHTQDAWGYRHYLIDPVWSLWVNTPATMSFVEQWLAKLSRTGLLFLIPAFSADAVLESLFLAKDHMKALYMPVSIPWTPVAHDPHAHHTPTRTSATTTSATAEYAHQKRPPTPTASSSSSSSSAASSSSSSTTTATDLRWYFSTAVMRSTQHTTSITPPSPLLAGGHQPSSSSFSSSPFSPHSPHSPPHRFPPHAYMRNHSAAAAAGASPQYSPCGLVVDVAN